MDGLKLYSFCAILWFAHAAPLLQKNVLEDLELSAVEQPTKATMSGFEESPGVEEDSVQIVVAGGPVTGLETSQVRSGPIGVPLNDRVVATIEPLKESDTKKPRRMAEFESVSSRNSQGHLVLSSREVAAMDGEREGSRQEQKTSEQESRGIAASVVDEGRRQLETAKDIGIVGSREVEVTVEKDETFRDAPVVAVQDDIVRSSDSVSNDAERSENSLDVQKPSNSVAESAEACQDTESSTNSRTCLLTPTVIAAPANAENGKQVPLDEAPEGAASTTTIATILEDEKVDEIGAVAITSGKHSAVVTMPAPSYDRSLPQPETTRPYLLFSSSSTPSAPTTDAILPETNNSPTSVINEIDEHEQKLSSISTVTPRSQSSDAPPVADERPPSSARAEGNETDQVKVVSEIWDELTRHDVSSEAFDTDCCLCEEEGEKTKNSADDASKTKEKISKMLKSDSINIPEDRRAPMGGTAAGGVTVAVEGGETMKQEIENKQSFGTGNENNDVETSRKSETIKNEGRLVGVNPTQETKVPYVEEEVQPVVITEPLPDKTSTNGNAIERVSDVVSRTKNASATIAETTTSTWERLASEVEEVEEVVEVEPPERSFWEKLIAGLKCSHRDCSDAFKQRPKPVRKTITPTIIRRAREHQRSCS